MNGNIANIEKVIDYIENNLSNKLDLDKISEAVHYSKYHLHRVFSDTVGMTIHDYVGRRQLTEAAKLLFFRIDRLLKSLLFAVMKVNKHFLQHLNRCIKFHLHSIEKIVNSILYS